MYARNAVFCGISCTWRDDTSHRKTRSWCPGPGSNRHGVASEGFSYSLQLSLLDLAIHLESGLSLCRVRIASCDVRLGRGRQVSTLSARSRWSRRERMTLRSSHPITDTPCGLARDCSHYARGSFLHPAGEAVSPNLTPFTPAVSEPGAQCFQVPCVYQFRHPGNGGAPFYASWARHGSV